MRPRALRIFLPQTRSARHTVEENVLLIGWVKERALVQSSSSVELDEHVVRVGRATSSQDLDLVVGWLLPIPSCGKLEDMLEFTARTNKRLANDLPKTKVLGVMRRNPVLAATDPGIADLLGSKIWLSLQESDVSAWPSVEHAKLPGSSAALACTLVLYTPTRQPLVVQRTGALREDLRASRSADLDAALACLNRIPEIEEILPAMGATPCVTPSWMARRLHSATGLFSAAARLTAHSCFSARHRMWTVRERAGVGQPSRLPNAALSHAYAYIQAASTVVHVLQSRAGGTGHSALEAGGGTYTAQRINGGPTACSSNSAPAEKGVRTGPSARAAEGHVDTGTAGEGASGDAVLRTLIDVLLGLVFGLVLWWHREEAARLVHAAGAWWSWMPEHLRWLMGAPAGLKVHRGLATLLGEAGLQTLEVASTAGGLLVPCIPYCVGAMAGTGIATGGLSLMLAIASDVIALMSFPVFLLYLGAAALFRQQRKGMRWSWMLIRPPSVAVAPTLGVAADLPSESILIERLIIGVLIYTPLILLLPTMGIFYASMWAAWFIMLGSQVTLHLILSTLLRTMQPYQVLLFVLAEDTAPVPVHLEGAFSKCGAFHARLCASSRIQPGKLISIALGLNAPMATFVVAIRKMFDTLAKSLLHGELLRYSL
ncbi:hypothetical protein CYMTET_49509 [Cymbomonas tetramitiformis]|uniref:Uncharacterized protein n=1 Tax=Cymbomonas tetramitiformis TaxID=36881 RepID=A0AAE0EU25_9CHLO|nr:hypothetical protein CYMTET_49509 [Cymbomonas tetramitiformis]